MVEGEPGNMEPLRITVGRPSCFPNNFASTTYLGYLQLVSSRSDIWPRNLSISTFQVRVALALRGLRCMRARAGERHHNRNASYHEPTLICWATYPGEGWVSASGILRRNASRTDAMWTISCFLTLLGNHFWGTTLYLLKSTCSRYKISVYLKC